jgi:protein-S-isoprenylcysteine O-methyltransferase Ste14
VPADRTVRRRARVRSRGRAGAARRLGVVRHAEPGVPLIAFVWVIQSNFIRGEERLLESIFGEQYLSYKGRVRRWI